MRNITNRLMISTRKITGGVARAGSPGDAPGTVGEAVGVVQHRAHNHDEAQGGHREIVALEAQHRPHR